MKSRNIKIVLVALLIISVTAIGYIREKYHQSSELFSTYNVSNDDNGYKKSEFIEFNGNDYYDINYKDIERIYYEYSSDLVRGEITLNVIVNNKEIWSSDKVRGETTGNGDIDTYNGENIKLRVSGKNASGSYQFQWEGKYSK